jgi:hypothetical protein
MARMVATNSFMTVTVGCCAVGVVIGCAVEVTVAGTAVFGVSVAGDWVVMLVVVAGSDIPQLLLMNATTAHNRKVRIINASINVRFTQ